MSGDDFHGTLERLRSARDEVESDFDRRLDALDARVAEARAALEAAAEVARRTGEAGAGPDAVSADPGASPEPARGGRVGTLGRLGAWVLRDALAARDVRQARLEADVEAWREQVREELEGLRARHRAGAGASREHVEAVRELAGRAAEAVESLAGVVRRLRDVLNAKEAETVHVATHGARAQAELTLEELARQQEALLAELVGRRAELDELLRRAGREPGER